MILIVLVDQLLTLLRERGELLELTALRLQWDRARWLMMLELRRLNADVKDILLQRADWSSKLLSLTPKSTADSLIHVPVTRAKRQDRTAFEVAKDREPASSPLRVLQADLKLPTIFSPPRIAAYLASSHHSAKAFGLTDMSGSKVTLCGRTTEIESSYLEMRHRHIAATLLPQSGLLLDKMIESAATLRGLGNMMKPMDVERIPGAVPEELLDLQDSLEQAVENTKIQIAGCNALNRQSEQ